MRIEAEIRDAIRFHIEGLQADGLDVPEPTIAEYVEAEPFVGRGSDPGGPMPFD